PRDPHHPRVRRSRRSHLQGLDHPELVKRWWGFDTSEWLVCDIDLREGGGWRFVIREAGDLEVGFHGEYQKTIEAPNRLVSTEVYEGFPDAAALNTMVLDERDGVTTMTVTVVHTCQEHRDGHIASGMEGGMQISMNRLEDLVAELDRAA
ncbi:MAG: SRPBCC domain-containing protein, partial [Aeromicrobium sp.]